ncbi:hypothetical protein BDK51DRAFT_32294 [Blyttiomyces helicus]|uniref:Uncharacterized protein n=1 Tax=Blyttiomyces helicus TaxID=388810 RepID=A0A4P9VY42_9FUNG|nr:hypothetical protein BDK51DRAFT_32294 [Blyttiomyces helicus]|eukprot:RKO84669.1 hypothetical protein BDK51DRAFT_32294 [Blyttiomyces helicus]
MPEIGPLAEPRLVSGASLAAIVRLAAVHANLFAQVFWHGLSGGGAYSSNSRERLRQIKRVQDRAAAAAAAAATTTATAGGSTGGSAVAAGSREEVKSLLDFSRFM